MTKQRQHRIVVLKAKKIINYVQNEGT